MDALTKLVETEFNGDPVKLLEEIGKRYGIAISYVTVTAVDAHVTGARGTGLTERERARVRDEFSSDPFDYDNWTTAEAVGYIDFTLDLLRITPPDGWDQWESED